MTQKPADIMQQHAIVQQQVKVAASNLAEAIPLNSNFIVIGVTPDGRGGQHIELASCLPNAELVKLLRDTAAECEQTPPDKAFTIRPATASRGRH